LDRSRLAIVIPAFNEAASIGRVVKEVSPFGRPVVVDDASTDLTGEVAGKAGAIVVTHETNHGYDGALSSGFIRADRKDFDYVITFDADGQHSAELLAEFHKLLDQGADLVVGIRPKNARISEKTFSVLANFFYGIRDPLCGMKGYRMSLYRDLGHFDSYGSIGTELTIFAAKHGYRIAQLPIPINPRKKGATRFGRVLMGNYLIFRALVLAFAKK
jgi:glycosyltransferase involved in cell wall biosynthesis